MLEYGLIIGLILLYFYTVTCVFLAVQIAELKGRRRRWGWLGFWLGLLGVIVVCCLPNAKGVTGETNPLKVVLRKVMGISPLATGLLLGGLALIVGGAILGTRLSLYFENKAHEEELSAGNQQVTLITQSTVPEAVQSVFSTNGGSFTVTKTGKLYGWGAISLLAPDETGVLYQNVKKVALEGNTCYLLTTDGTLYGKGNNANGLVYGQEAAWVDQFVVLERDVADFSLSATAAGILKSSGNLYMVGLNRYQQLGQAAEKVSNTNTRLAGDVAQVVVSARSVCYRLNNGAVYALGNNAYGQFGLGHREAQGNPVKIAEGCASVAMGDVFVLLLKQDGTVWSAGSDALGQLGRVEEREAPVAPPPAEGEEKQEEKKEEKKEESLPEIKRNTFYQVEGLPANMTGIVADGSCAFAFLNETLYAWGDNRLGQLGAGSVTASLPEVVYRKAAAVSTDGQVSMLLSTDGKLLATGDQRDGRLGNSNGGKFREMATVKGGES